MSGEGRTLRVNGREVDGGTQVSARNASGGMRSIDAYSLSLVIQDDRAWDVLCALAAEIHQRKALTDAGAVECVRCGALVFDVKKHNEWHDENAGPKS